MVQLCDYCAALDLGSLFFNDFCKASQCLDLVTDLNDDVDTHVLVSRQREDILLDPEVDEVDVVQDQLLLEEFMATTDYTGDLSDTSVHDYIKRCMFAPLDANKYATLILSSDEISGGAVHCDLCHFLSDQRLWRLPSPVTLSTFHDTQQLSSQIPRILFLFSTWPCHKAMWHDNLTSPNELYLIETNSTTSIPPDTTDDCLLDRLRDERTLCLFDHPKSMWKAVPPLIDWSSIMTWLPEFVSNSGALGELGDSKSSSFMLLDVLTDQVIHFASLDCVKYAALSYVWGAARTSEDWCRQIQVGHDSGEQQPLAIDAASLPATIRDAMTICKNLMIPYLWVDSLCIAQNQVLPQANAIADMGRIYMACYLCIIAAADGSIHDPLPGVEIPRLQQCLQIGQIKIGISPPRLRDTVHSSKWNSRGWCFQESTLAPRSLVILKDQVFCQSGTSVWCESVKVNIGNNYDKPNDAYHEEPLTSVSLFADTGTAAAFSVYKDLVVNYTKRDLSFESDIENAFNGIALLLDKRFSLKLWHGLSCSHFVQSLNWFCPNATSVAYCVGGIGAVHDPSRRRLDSDKRPFGPSWSWMSRVGRIEYTSIPLAAVDVPECFSSLTTGSTDQFPTYGLEGHFASKSMPASIEEPSLLAPLKLRTILYHANQIRVVWDQVMLSTWLDDLRQHRYLLDDALRTTVSGDVYVLPLAYRRDAPQNISAALLVELFEYPGSVTVALRDQEDGTFHQSVPSRRIPVKRPLTAAEMRRNCYVARRVGIVPYGLAELDTVNDTHAEQIDIILA